MKEWKGIPLTELKPASGYTIAGNNLYIVVVGNLFAVDINTGKNIWGNVRVGASHDPVVDTDGNIYCAGYYGPFVTAVSAEGTVKWQRDEDSILIEGGSIGWPYETFLNGDEVSIFFGMSDNPKINCVSFDKETGDLLKVFWIEDADAPEAWDSVTASSTLQSAAYDYSPGSVVDNNDETAWVEGKDDYGAGEWLLLKSQKEKEIHRLSITNGYHKSPEHYQDNSRAKRIIIEFSDGSSLIKDLDDEMTGVNIILGRIIRKDSVKFTILEVDPGKKYKDTCVSEITTF